MSTFMQKDIFTSGLCVLLCEVVTLIQKNYVMSALLLTCVPCRNCSCQYFNFSETQGENKTKNKPF